MNATSSQEYAACEILLFFLPESEKEYFTPRRFESRCQKSAVENVFSSGGSDDCQETKYISKC